MPLSGNRAPSGRLFQVWSLTERGSTAMYEQYLVAIDDDVGARTELLRTLGEQHAPEIHLVSSVPGAELAQAGVDPGQLKRTAFRLDLRADHRSPAT